MGFFDRDQHRLEFLEEQAKEIGGTNTLYTIVSLGLFLLSTTIMLNNYKDTKRLGRRLSIAEKSAMTDPLTGVKNRYSYLQYSEKLDRQIEDNTVDAFTRADHKMYLQKRALKVTLGRDMR